MSLPYLQVSAVGPDRWTCQIAQVSTGFRSKLPRNLWEGEQLRFFALSYR